MDGRHDRISDTAAVSAAGQRDGRTCGVDGRQTEQVRRARGRLAVRGRSVEERHVRRGRGRTGFLGRDAGQRHDDASRRVQDMLGRQEQAEAEQAEPRQPAVQSRLPQVVGKPRAVRRVAGRRGVQTVVQA